MVALDNPREPTARERAPVLIIFHQLNKTLCKDTANMAEPPSYEESTLADGKTIMSDEKKPQRFSICEEVGASRSQHVAALVSKLLPQIRSRAKNGLSKSTLLLLPSDQDCTRKGQLVGFADGDSPLIIQLEGRHDSLEFWLQMEAIADLRNQMYLSIAGALPAAALPQVPPPQRPPQQTPQRSWFGSKQEKAPNNDTTLLPMSTRPLVLVEVKIEEVNFRTENKFGLYETLRGKAVTMVVEAN
ncbi:Hypothetical protein R9X50_00298000 [Acrodontium crateriforme]|uniref:Uncharacterized protein n=1 Tax=Acrodontium crateriforme TaxID=150365 RepID=A0AAQ3M356_9PEZI|nr:Hypothetical protein R9X50_00298000 [Acrodontium crateriforme]